MCVCVCVCMIFFSGLWALNVSAAWMLGVRAEAESGMGDLGGRVPWQHLGSEDLHGGQWSEQPLLILWTAQNTSQWDGEKQKEKARHLVS